MLIALLFIAGVATAAPQPLADAIHGISLQCTNTDGYETCTSFATSALASCGPGDLPCQCNQVSAIKDYCGSVCHTKNVHSSTAMYLRETCKDIKVEPPAMQAFEHLLYSIPTHESVQMFQRAAKAVPKEIATELSLHNIIGPHTPTITLNALESQLRPLIQKLRVMISEENAEARSHSEVESPNLENDSNQKETDILLSKASKGRVTDDEEVSEYKRDFVVHHVDCCATAEDRVRLLNNLLASATALDQYVHSTTVISEKNPFLDSEYTDDESAKLAPRGGVKNFIQALVPHRNAISSISNGSGTTFSYVNNSSNGTAASSSRRRLRRPRNGTAANRTASANRTRISNITQAVRVNGTAGSTSSKSRNDSNALQITLMAIAMATVALML